MRKKDRETIETMKEKLKGIERDLGIYELSFKMICSPLFTNPPTTADKIKKLQETQAEIMKRFFEETVPARLEDLEKKLGYMESYLGIEFKTAIRTGYFKKGTDAFPPPAGRGKR